MKVRVTYDIDEQDRIAISVVQGEGFKPAPREDILLYLNAVVSADLVILRRRFELATQQIIGQMEGANLARQIQVEVTE